ncbi:response regulator [Undibacterium oligocarboniphilum]|uniref:Response regulatory domain-containing protein n=1 Tax=Undibacterium oligocarboniphilum TaxID=666702 RepID=A0A850QMH7_9BURK|nr:hypothetical protein [Undibacterium oligocarboniphilum]MBC3871328.1 hypothetical protein [Undibacterium oligocarboniphilum]NVO78825.1 hypothetical protein [Undibacterium oligocarboniphilum]
MKAEHSKTPGLQNNGILIGIGSGKRSGYTGFVNIHDLNTCSNHDIAATGSLDDDLIDFLDEEPLDSHLKKALHPWKILITDDDTNVHDTTLLALNGVRIHGRPLEFLHAYSAREAQDLILSYPDLSLVLLDVVMETVDAGLKLVKIIRDELGKKDLKIVLRTGQPGYAPEEKVNHQFAIDGYTTKSKLTRSLLISVLNDALAGEGSSGHLPN